MTTMATETRAFQPGDRVRGNVSEREGTVVEVNPGGRTMVVDWTVAGRRGALGRQQHTSQSMVTLIEQTPESAEPESEPEMQHGFRVGQRVRTSYGPGTVAPHDNPQIALQYVCVRQDGHTDSGYYHDGRYVIHPGGVTPLDEPDVPVTPAAPVAITVGARVRVSDPAYSGPVSGYVTAGAYGQEGTVERGPNSAGLGSWVVVGDSGRFSQHIHENFLTVISGGSDESAAADTPEDDGQAQIGDVVTINYINGEGRVMRRTNDRPGMSFSYTRGSYQGIVQVRFPDQDTELYAGDLRFVRRDSSPIPEISANYGEGFEPGTRVWASGYGGMGTVMEKNATNCSRAAYVRNAQYSAVRFDGNQTVTVLNNHSLALRDDTDLASLTDAEKLERLQRMIHRVASYEAVRREWCDEVNTALSHLAGLLPTELQSVNRDLGRYLREHPREIFRLDTGPQIDTSSDDDDDDPDDDEPEDVDWRADVTVDYNATDGFVVSGASVSVYYTAPDDHDASDYIDDSMVESGIDDSDLPGIDRAGDIRSFTIDETSQV